MFQREAVSFSKLLAKAVGRNVPCDPLDLSSEYSLSNRPRSSVSCCSFSPSANDYCTNGPRGINSQPVQNRVLHKMKLLSLALAFGVVEAQVGAKDALMAIYDATDGANWHNNAGWGSDTDYCTCVGVRARALDIGSSCLCAPRLPPSSLPAAAHASPLLPPLLLSRGSLQLARYHVHTDCHAEDR